MTGDVATAEDLVQETCLKAHRGFCNFNPGSNFKAWIFRILKNAWMDARRKDSRCRIIEFDSAVMEREAEKITPIRVEQSCSPETAVMMKMFQSDAFEAMTDLPEDMRMIVALALLEELSYQEISEIVGCPVGTVRSRLSRGRQRLQCALANHAPLDGIDRELGRVPAEGGVSIALKKV